MCKEVDLLEEAYNKLPDIPHFSTLIKICEGKMAEYHTGSTGKFTSESLLDEPGISIAKSHITKGTRVPLHNHPNSYEILIILEGSMDVDFLSHNEILMKDDFIKIDMEIPHTVTTIEDTTFIALTVPRDEGFPRR